MSSNLEEMQEGGSEEWGVGSGDNADREEGDIDKEPEGHQSPKDIDEEVTEEIKWPCSVCGLSVLEDSKKARDEGEAIDTIDMIDGERKDIEEVTYTSPLKRAWNYLGSYIIPTGGKVEIHEGK